MSEGTAKGQVADGKSGEEIVEVTDKEVDQEVGGSIICSPIIFPLHQNFVLLQKRASTSHKYS